MNFEAVSQMKKSEKSERPEKSQDDLRAEFELRLNALKSPLEQGMKDYQEALGNGTFDDKEGEESGSGEKRMEEMQKKLTALLDRAERMKTKLDSGEELPQITPEISSTYVHPDKRQETITLNIENSLQSFISLYQKTKIDIPEDFEQTVLDIWEKNQIEIQEAIEEKGFDYVIIAPANIPLTELKDKMGMENGFYEYGNFKDGGSFSGAKSQNVDKVRLILVHKTQELMGRPELASTLNIKGQDVKLDQALSLEDYIVFQRQYFEETKKHLDEKKYTWLATKSGSRLVDSHWDPSGGELNVLVDDLDYQIDDLGVRPSRSFF